MRLRASCPEFRGACDLSIGPRSRALRLSCHPPSSRPASCYRDAGCLHGARHGRRARDCGGPRWRCVYREKRYGGDTDGGRTRRVCGVTDSTWLCSQRLGRDVTGAYEGRSGVMAATHGARIVLAAARAGPDVSQRARVPLRARSRRRPRDTRGLGSRVGSGDHPSSARGSRSAQRGGGAPAAPAPLPARRLTAASDDIVVPARVRC